MFGNIKLILGTGVVIIALILCLAFLLNKTLNKNKKNSKSEDSELIYLKDSDSANNEEMDSSLSGGNSQPSKPNESNPSEDLSRNPGENSDEDSEEDSDDDSENDTDASDSSEDADDDSDDSPVKITKSLTIYSGNTDRIKINSTEGKPENITYTPEDTSIAEVINGHVIAKQEGVTNVFTKWRKHVLPNFRYCIIRQSVRYFLRGYRYERYF